jgi:hypothetical protein
MAFDPYQEDCQRLVLHRMSDLHASPSDYEKIGKLIAFYQSDPDQLIQNDKDRAFHLVAKATELLDYRVPFMTNEQEAEACAQTAENQLREAISLDPDNWDAKRMLAAITAASNDAYVTYLEDHVDEVKASATKNLRDESMSALEQDANELDTRAWLRWLAALASRQLIAGRYRRSLEAAEQCLFIDPIDTAGARHTAVLALAKLQSTTTEIRTFIDEHEEAYKAETAGQPGAKPRPGVETPWALIALMASCYQNFEQADAEAYLAKLLDCCPNAAEALTFQTEFPDGVYARVNVAPGSTDELVLALSEATPLLQEGFGAPENASFAAWVATHELVRSKLDPATLEKLAAIGYNAGGVE